MTLIRIDQRIPPIYPEGYRLFRPDLDLHPRREYPLENIRLKTFEGQRKRPSMRGLAVHEAIQSQLLVEYSLGLRDGEQIVSFGTQLFRKIPQMLQSRGRLLLWRSAGMFNGIKVVPYVSDVPNDLHIDYAYLDDEFGIEYKSGFYPG